MNDDAKKAADKQQIEQQEALDKQQEEQREATEAQNRQEEDNQLLDNEILAQQEIDELNQEYLDEQGSPTFPRWMTDVTRLFLEYEGIFGKLGEAERAEAATIIEDVLGDLAENNIIKNFEATAEQGFSVFLADETRIIFDLVDNKIFTNSTDEKVFETIGSVLKAVGGNELDVSPLEDSTARFSAWKSATENNFDVKGIAAEELEHFKNTASPKMG